MNGTDEDDEVDSEEDGPMPVDEFIKLPNQHPKKVAFWRFIHGLPGGGEDDGT